MTVMPERWEGSKGNENICLQHDLYINVHNIYIVKAQEWKENKFLHQVNWEKICGISIKCRAS